MKEKKFLWDSYHLPDFQKSSAQRLKDELDPDEDEEAIEELEHATTIFSTPMGLFEQNDSMNPLRTIEHWICKTNFNIDSQVTALLNSIDGVETLTVVTRYQFIVGFGELFTVKEVRAEIEETLRNIDVIPKTKLNRMVRQMYNETCLGGN